MRSLPKGAVQPLHDCKHDVRFAPPFQQEELRPCARAQAREAAELGQKLREARARAKELGETAERERQATALATSELEVCARPPAPHQAQAVRPRRPPISGTQDAQATMYWHPAVLQAFCMRGRQTDNVIRHALFN